MRPCQELFLEVAVPDPALNLFTLDRDKLDGPKLLSPDPTPVANPAYAQAFTLNVSLLDSVKDLIELAGGADLPPGFVWLSMMTKTTSISIDRGLDIRQGIVARPIAGTLTASIIDPNYDALFNPGIGLTSLVRVRVNNEPVFVGEVTRIETTYTPAGLPRVDLQAADGIAKLNSIMLPARPAETYAERVNAVAQATDLTVTTTAAGLAQRATDEARTALETLYLAQDTEAGWAMINRKNSLIAWPRGQAETATPPAFTLSDRHLDPDHDACITGIETGITTDQVINNLTVLNLRFDDSDPDPARHRWVSDTHEYQSPRSQRFYGVAQTRVTTAMDEALLTDYQSFCFTNYGEPERKIVAIEYETDDFTSSVVPPIALIDVGDAVHIRMRAPATGAATIDQTERVVRISHTITPTNWVTQLAVA